LSDVSILSASVNDVLKAFEKIRFLESDFMFLNIVRSSCEHLLLLTTLFFYQNYEGLK